MAKHQAIDEEINHFHEQLKPYPINRQTILCNISLPFPWPYVRQELRKLVFDSLHNLSHPGISASVKMMVGVLMTKNEQIDKKKKKTPKKEKKKKHGVRYVNTVRKQK